MERPKQLHSTLEQFAAQHHYGYVSLQQCAQHVSYQLQNEHSTVGLLMQAIQCFDARLQATMANADSSIGPDGMQENFEVAAAYLLANDPETKKWAGTQRHAGLISSIAGAQTSVAGEEADAVSATAAKPIIGKTGVHLQYYKQREYHAHIRLREGSYMNGETTTLVPTFL